MIVNTDNALTRPAAGYGQAGSNSAQIEGAEEPESPQDLAVAVSVSSEFDYYYCSYYSC